MAEANFDDFGEGGASLGGIPTQKAINLAGGAISALLVIGLAVWGYRLAVRDVNGIPVIQAMQGPMRITPEDPGGQIAANVGLTVNRVAADAAGVPRTDNIILAPAPVQLADGDLAPADRPAPVVAPAAPAPADSAVAAVAAPAAAPDPAAAPVVADAAPLPDPTAAAAPVVAQTQAAPHGAPTISPRPKARPAVLMAAATEPQPPAKAVPAKAVPVPPAVPAAVVAAPAVEAPSAAAAAIKAVAMPAAATKAPPARPAVLTQAAASTPKPAKAADTVDPAKLPLGTHLVQLGAYDTPDAAAEAWAVIKAKFGDQMDGKSRVIQKASSGGRDFYRLRAAGFKDDAETRRFCTTFDAANAPCVPVVLR